MRKILSAVAAVLALTSVVACGGKTEKASAEAEQPAFITAHDGKFWRGDSAYKYTGTNFWYGPMLASTGRGGDRERLAHELDLIQANGINNLRVVVGGDGEEGLYAHIMPVLQPEPGVYNDTILDGLDYFMAELEKRDMTAVIYLNNSWEWSGGYSAYLQWATGERQPIPAIDGYQTYVDGMAAFVKNDSAKTLAANHVRNIVSRTNRYTGKPYSESPALMAWQIANEPRAFASDSVTMTAFKQWIKDQAALIKSIDPNHMVSTGSEGSVGCEGDIEVWNEIHRDPNIDYATIHIWPANWGWVKTEDLVTKVDTAIAYTQRYIDAHVEKFKDSGKPLIIEEFGYPRDGRNYATGTPVVGRDAYYTAVFNAAETNPYIAATNFWPWGGDVIPPHQDAWQPWDPYTGDPAQEPQGLYSVFANDSTTLAIIRQHAANMRDKK